MTERLILCGGTQVPGPDLEALRLNLATPGQNITLRVHDVSRPLVENIPDLLADLLEVATYVYCADQATGRGGPSMANLGERWRRSFHFVIPVRQPEVWSSPQIQSVLIDTLTFLSEDTYRFTFEPLRTSPSIQPYFEFGKEQSGSHVEEVILFSGGLDSLAGAVEALVGRQHRVALVSHQSATRIMPYQAELIADLRQRVGAGRLLHVPVLIHKDAALSHDYTQRTRSFLFASLGIVVGRLFGVSTVRLCENGIVSFNLPISEQLVGARASRTTHPQALDGFGRLFSMLFGETVTVENPFVWNTKSEIVQTVADHDCAEMIGKTVSCGRVHLMTQTHTHCGVCSQCLTRRFAVLASGQDVHDPAERYVVDLLTGRREPGEVRTIAESFVRTALEIHEASDAAFFCRFPEISRALRYLLPMTSDEAAHRILELHKRHAGEIRNVLVEAVDRYGQAPVHRELPDDCLLRLVDSQGQIVGAAGQPRKATSGMADRSPASRTEADAEVAPPSGSGDVAVRRSTAAAEGRCRRWLTEMMAGGEKTKIKDTYFDEAQNIFGVSRRAFDQSWSAAVAETGNYAWSQPGRRARRQSPARPARSAQ